MRFLPFCPPIFYFGASGNKNRSGQAFLLPCGNIAEPKNGTADISARHHMRKLRIE